MSKSNALPRGVAFAALCSALALPAYAQTSSLPLFSAPVSASPNKVDGRTSATLKAIKGNPTTKAMHLVTANTSSINKDADQLALNVAPGIILNAARTDSYENKDGTLVWVGTLEKNDKTLKRLNTFGPSEVDEEPLSSVVLVRNGNRMTGTVRADGKTFRIVSLDNGNHAITEIDESKLPPDHPEGAPRVTPSPSLSVPVPPSSPRAASAIKVGFLFTQGAADGMGDIQSAAQLAVAETNQSYVNSGIDATLELAGVRTTTYNGTNFNSDLDRFTGTNDGYMDDWHAYRDSIGADVSVLINTGTSYCGMGWINSNARNAFSVVAENCASGGYVVAHEIGHNFGAHHNPETGANNSTYPYGHGYYNLNGRWRTIMSYDCPGGCQRTNYWSNPDKTYNGVPMGSEQTHNNTRLLNERAATMASFR